MELRIKGVLSPKASGSITITENGNYDVVDVANAVVEVKPSGTIEIAENGEHDVANYAVANVNVVDEESAINLETLQILVDGWATNSNFRLFQGKNIKSIPKSIDFSNVTQTNYFSSCNMLEEVEDINVKNVKSLQYWFGNCQNLKKIINVDCSSATTLSSFAYNCPQLVEVSLKNANNVTEMRSAFQNSSALEKVDLDGDLINDMQQAFYGCKKLKEVRFKKAKPSILQSCFVNCDSLKTVELNLINASNVSSFLRVEYLENLYLYNIKIDLEIATSAGYGNHLTKESLIHTIQELIDTGSSKTLTMKSTNINKIANVYVKVISEAPDENGNVKLPFEVCESTDEGAMLITNYVTLKNWALA